MYKDQLQPYDIIVVYNPKSWLHKLIYRVTEYKAGHVALYVGNGKIYQATSHGVQCNDVRNYTDKHKIFICRYWENLLTQMHNDAILQYCEKSAGKKYAFLQLAMMLLKYTFRLSRVPDVSKSAMICSEFVAEAFEYAGIDLCFKPSHEVTPADILNSKKLWRIECQ